MNKRFFIVLAFFLAPFLMFGCDTGTDTIQIHDIVEFKWQSDGNAIFGLEQKYATTATSVQPAIGYTLSRFAPDGTLAQTYDVSPKSRTDFSNSLFISSDGSTAVTQLEIDLYRFSMATGTLEKLQTVLHLITVSPDLKYVVGSPSPASQPIKTVNVYDISSSPIRLVTHFDVNRLASSCGVWLNNGTFGITALDSVGSHVSIYDTTASLITTIGGAEIQFHNFVFNPQTNHLYIRNYANKATDYFVDKIDLTTLSRETALNFKVENFDITKDENIAVYSAFSTNSITIKSRNLTSMNEVSIATDILRIISLSPSEDRLAYVRGTSDQNEIHVIPFTRP